MGVNVNEKSCELSLEVQEFVGNQKEFRIECNKIHLRIIGNNNRILLKVNDGKLEIIGNSCKVKIVTNNGDISYLGSNGKIYLGRKSSITKVHYTGMHGSVRLLDTVSFVNNNHQEKPFQKTEKSTTTKEQILESKLLSINVKNNISLPNLDEIKENQKFNCRSSFKISNSTGDLCVNNFFKKPAAIA